MIELDDHALAVLQALSRHEGWPIYLRLLSDYHETTTKALKQPIASPVEQANHNANVGRLSAIEKCQRVIADVLKTNEDKQ